MKDMLAQNGPYRVSLLAGDLQHEELIHQVAESLDQLKVVIDDVFSNVQRKITANKTRLAKIDERTRLAQLKVDKLKGRKKATQVFSSAKYPGEETHTYHSMFAQKDSTAVKKHGHYRMKTRQHLPPTDEDINDKHKFYSVKVAKTSSADLSSEGLGRLPHNIDSISSLLLFNTSENPYKKYVMLDPRGVVTKMREMGNEESFGPADAPATIALGDEAISQKQETYIYRPDLGEVPMISVPDTLPDLLDVADDMIYGADTGPSIAPSVFSQLDLPELPAVVEETTPKDMPTEVAGSAPPPPPPPSSAAPPPPPPPSAAAPPPPPPPPAAAAPPPPPPAPAAPADTSPPPATEPAPAASSGGGGDGGRGDLLDAIRNAGGAGKARLKKAAERKVERKKEKEVKSSGGGGLDMFAEMTNKILLRRQGIAGFKGAAKQAVEKPSQPPASEPPTGMMSKMSELIPYNPANESKDDDDDEWDD